MSDRPSTERRIKLTAVERQVMARALMTQIEKLQKEPDSSVGEIHIAFSLLERVTD